MGIAVMPAGIALLLGPPVSGMILGMHYHWLKGILFSSVSNKVKFL